MLDKIVVTIHYIYIYARTFVTYADFRFYLRGITTNALADTIGISVRLLFMNRYQITWNDSPQNDIQVQTLQLKKPEFCILCSIDIFSPQKLHSR
jgi:hypothetical protein